MAQSSMTHLFASAAVRLSSRGDLLRRTIDRYFQVSLLLLVITGIATLAATGRLDLPSLAMVTTALLVRGLILLRGRAVNIPERWTNYASIAYVLVFAADVVLVSRSYVVASVHLVLFALIVKLFAVHRDRDYLYLAALALLAVLASSVLTIDTRFLVLFLVFILLAVNTFISMEIRRSLARAPACGYVPAEMRMNNRVRRSLAGIAMAMLLAIVVGALVLFFVLPRSSAGYLSTYARRTQFTTGFSDRVLLGEIGLIKQSSAVVMHIQTERSLAGMEVNWRGVALTIFDGKQWSNRDSWQVLESAPGRFPIRLAQLARGNLTASAVAARNPNLLRYRVLMEPIGTNVVFVAPVAVEIAGQFRLLTIDDGGSIANIDHERSFNPYEAISLLQPRDATILRRQFGSYPPALATSYLQLPALDQRIAELAARVTTGSTSAYDKAAALEQYLQVNYGYTLQLPNVSPQDPLADFLFERKKGHCEYFASAMTVMLRSVGIPARLVNGFRTGELNPLTGSYIVRARDAHSWVEAYIPNTGWVGFDPTPPDPSPAAGDWARFLLYVDAAQQFWREWVVNYDFGHQRTLGTSFARTGQHWTSWLREKTRLRWFALLRRARSTAGKVVVRPWTWGAGALVAFGVSFLVWNRQKIWRAVGRSRAARAPDRVPSIAAAIWYERMLRVAARRGFAKAPAQTPEEFVASIADKRLQDEVSVFTRSYRRARFGQSAEDAARLPQLYEGIVSHRS